MITWLSQPSQIEFGGDRDERGKPGGILYRLLNDSGLTTFAVSYYACYLLLTGVVWKQEKGYSLLRCTIKPNYPRG
jgi:hypothetical protein